MSIALKLFLTAIALGLIASGGVSFALTTVPGVAMLGWVWGFSDKIK